MRVGVATAVAVAVASGGGGCGKDKAGYNGIGPYQVGKTTLKDARGRCDPTDLPDGRKGTWCYLQPELTVVGRPATVDLYFAGTEPSAPVIEIQLQVRGCKDDELTQWLRTHFGAPSEEHGAWIAWQSDRIYLIGELPSAPGRCLVRVLPRSERAEFERLRTKALTPAP